MERQFRDEITSFCYFHLFDDGGRRFDVLVKSNIFNFELVFNLHLAQRPAGLTAPMAVASYDQSALSQWAVVVENPLMSLASGTMYGSLSEGYTVHLDAVDIDDGVRVTYRLRQRTQSNFLTTPYLRRYFAEDAAIAAYYLYAEALASNTIAVTGGEHI